MDRIKKIGRETFASLNIRNYRLYFIGQTISLSGTWMQTIGQSWLVLQLTNSGAALGLVTAAQFVPMMIFGPWGGVVTDRFDKRKVLYFTQTASGILAFILGALVATGVVRLWMVYVLAVALGLVNTVDNPTRQTFVVEMVGKENLTNAVSLNSTLVNLARVIGPAIGGALIAIAGLAPLFFINSVSFVAVLVVIWMMNKKELYRTPLAEKSQGQLLEGFRYVKSVPALRDTLLMMAIIGTLTYEFAVILPLVAQFTFHGDATTYAWLTVTMGLGSMLGGLYTASRRRHSQKTLINSAWLFGAVVLLSAVMPTITLELAAMVLVGFYSIIFLSLGNTTLQLESSPQMRGRVMALWAVAFLGSTPIGGPIIGFIGQYLSPRWGLATGGFAAILAAVLGYWLYKKDQANSARHPAPAA
ncbi:MAG: MFS transporter [Patescibacteria group bacterium]|nr:MFS transporter [Patescibacteria group bacterium]